MALKMFYEKHVATLKALMREAGTMDPDAGIRLAGRYGGRNCYCFVTKFGGAFTAMIYAKGRGAKGPPGELLDSLELRGSAQLGRLLREVAGSKVDAYVY